MTESDLLKALSEARPAERGNDPGWTIAELAVKQFTHDTKCNRDKVSRQLHKLKADGRLIVGRRNFERINDQPPIRLQLVQLPRHLIAIAFRVVRELLDR